MLVIDVRDGRDEKRRLSFTRHTLSLGKSLPTLLFGSDDKADVRLSAGVVEALHARVVERDGVLQVEPLAPTKDSTLVDGDAVHAPTTLAIGSVVGIADCTITIIAFTPMVPSDFEISEQDFVAPLRKDRSDVGMRLVYADMLEEKGWLVRAEYLRVQVRLLLDEPLEGDREALGRLTNKLAPARQWERAVGAPALAQKCAVEAGRACPVKWGTAKGPATCGKCGRAVAYATS